MAVTGDPFADMTLGGGIIGTVAAVIRWGPQLIAVLRPPAAPSVENDGQETRDQNRSIAIHDRLNEIEGKQQDHDVSDAGIHAELRSNLGNLTERVDELRSETKTGFTSIEDLIRQDQRDRRREGRGNGD